MGCASTQPKDKVNSFIDFMYNPGTKQHVYIGMCCEMFSFQQQEAPFLRIVCHLHIVMAQLQIITQASYHFSPSSASSLQYDKSSLRGKRGEKVFEKSKSSCSLSQSTQHYPIFLLPSKVKRPSTITRLHLARF